MFWWKKDDGFAAFTPAFCICNEIYSSEENSMLFSNILMWMNVIIQSVSSCYLHSYSTPSNTNNANVNINQIKCMVYDVYRYKQQPFVGSFFYLFINVDMNICHRNTQICYCFSTLVYNHKIKKRHQQKKKKEREKNPFLRITSASFNICFIRLHQTPLSIDFNLLLFISDWVTCCTMFHNLALFRTQCKKKKKTGVFFLVLLKTYGKSSNRSRNDRKKEQKKKWNIYTLKRVKSWFLYHPVNYTCREPTNERI